MNVQFTYNEAVFRVAHSANKRPVSKAEIRTLTRQRRAAGEHELIDATLISHLLDWLGSATRVAAYSPMPGEPGGADLVASLAAKYEVWLPITPKKGELRWGLFDGELHQGAHFGIWEPKGPGEADLSSLELDAVLVPALGIDRSGVRLGQGAGYYDRALAKVTCPIIAVVYDDELHEELPSEPHDHPVDGVVTQSGFQWLGNHKGQ